MLTQNMKQRYSRLALALVSRFPGFWPVLTVLGNGQQCTGSSCSSLAQRSPAHNLQSQRAMSQSKRQQQCPHPHSSQDMNGSNECPRQVVCRLCGKTLFKVWPHQVTPALLDRVMQAVVRDVHGPPSSTEILRLPPTSSQVGTQTRTKAMQTTKLWKRLVLLALYQEPAQ